MDGSSIVRPERRRGRLTWSRYAIRVGRATELSGTLLDSAGRPASGYYVVVFPKEESLWAQGSRRLPAPARAATNGTFKFAGLPPGTYCIAAHTNVDAADLADAAFLKQLVASATTITLGEGEKKVQDLKIGGAVLGSITSVTR